MDLQFLPFNKRTTAVIAPMIVQRMAEGGHLCTDCWEAYIGAAKAVMVHHLTVNHSKEFKSPKTGACTNNCEGIHGVIKRDGFSQFGRLPYLNNNGETYYLDLLVWRANARLKGIPLFEDFCKILWLWAQHPLEDWNRRIPLNVDEPEELGEEHDDEPEELGEEFDDEDSLEDMVGDDWFLAAEKVQTEGDEAEGSDQEEATVDNNAEEQNKETEEDNVMEQNQETEDDETVEIMTDIHEGLLGPVEQVE